MSRPATSFTTTGLWAQPTGPHGHHQPQACRASTSRHERAISGMSVRLYLALPLGASGPTECGSTNAWAAMTRSPLKVSAGDPCS